MAVHYGTSLAELNAAIWELLERLNNKKFKKLPTTRRELFGTLDCPALMKPLPDQRYPFVDWKTAKVNIDYHVEVDRHFYSVPYQLVGEQVDVRLGQQTLFFGMAQALVHGALLAYFPAPAGRHHRLGRRQQSHPDPQAPIQIMHDP